MRHLLPTLALPSLLLGAGLAACTAPSQPPAPIVTLSPARDTVRTTDTDLSDAVWLGGDRWALLAPAAKVVRIVDFAAHTTKPLGRPGTDYAEPFALFRVGDTLYVNDWGKRRVTFWTLAGGLVGTLDAPDALRGALPRDRDSTGAWYAELRPFPGRDGSGNLDSGAVVRWAGGATIDTVVGLAPFGVEKVAREGAPRYERTVFGGEDRWGVERDGSIWIARVRENLLQRCGPARGACRSGPALRDRVLEVTLQDREYFLQGYPEDQRTLARTVPFAIVKPPFDEAFTDRAGAVFLEKSRALTDSVRGYAMLAPNGIARQELRLPNAQRILGAGGGHLLAIDPLIPGPGHRVLRYVLPAVDTTGK
jgi:hypothetical protein